MNRVTSIPFSQPHNSPSINCQLLIDINKRRRNMAEELLKTAYEVARENRLRRNREMLQAIGLTDTVQSIEAVAGESSEEGSKRKQVRKPRERLEATRRSKRVQGLSPEGQPVHHSEDEEVGGDDDAEESDDNKLMRAKIERLKALHEERNTAYKNPTATYEHTWMRVRTMSDKALARRISVIEKALGQHCVVKMRMFAEVLLLAHKDELAKQASEALERLLALVGES